MAVTSDLKNSRLLAIFYVSRQKGSFSYRGLLNWLHVVVDLRVAPYHWKFMKQEEWVFLGGEISEKTVIEVWNLIILPKFDQTSTSPLALEESFGGCLVLGNRNRRPQITLFYLSMAIKINFKSSRWQTALTFQLLDLISFNYTTIIF